MEQEKARHESGSVTLEVDLANENLNGDRRVLLLGGDGVGPYLDTA